MRVTGGELRGREVAVPAGRAVRPTQDRVRQALFSALATRIAGSQFLDLFAGSGAVGLEAWSRGAAGVVWVEQNPRVLRVLQANIGALCAPAGVACGTARAVRSDVLGFLERPGEHGCRRSWRL